MRKKHAKDFRKRTTGAFSGATKKCIRQTRNRKLRRKHKRLVETGKDDQVDRDGRSVLWDLL